MLTTHYVGGRNLLLYAKEVNQSMASDIHVGDMVLIRSVELPHVMGRLIGRVFTVMSIGESGNKRPYVIFEEGGDKWVFSRDEIELVSTAKNPMTRTLNLIQKALLDSETKTLVKAGVLSSDLSVNDTDFILSFIVEKNKTELAAAAQAKLDEEAKK